MTGIKVCGFVDAQNAAEAASTGVSWLGLNFWPESKRFVCEEGARKIATAARAANPKISIVGLFVNQSAQQVVRLVQSVDLDLVQLHGDESPEFVASLDAPCMKALALGSAADVSRMRSYDCRYFLVDSPSEQRGGSGIVANWRWAARAAKEHSRVFLAGGLTAENVGSAIAAVRPFAVDVASGVEIRAGYKDIETLARFVEAVRGAE